MSASGTNGPTIYTGSIIAGSRSFFGHEFRDNEDEQGQDEQSRMTSGTARPRLEGGDERQ